MVKPQEPAIVYHVHGAPVWQSRADSIIQAPFHFEGKHYAEQLWARRLDSGLFEICCIPVFLYNLALGDHVEAPEYVLRRVAKRSGHYAFRVRFPSEASVASDIMRTIEEKGYLFEWHSPVLVAIDAEGTAAAQALADFLVDYERRGKLQYESALEADPDQLSSDSDFSRMGTRGND